MENMDLRGQSETDQRGPYKGKFLRSGDKDEGMPGIGPQGFTLRRNAEEASRLLQAEPSCASMVPKEHARLGCPIVLLHQCDLEYLGVDQLLSSQGLLSGEMSSQEINTVPAQEQRSGAGAGDWSRKSAIEE